jgi:hypothetical protein
MAIIDTLTLDTWAPPNTIATDGWEQHGGGMVVFI